MSYHHQAQIVCSRTITSRRIIAQLQSQREQRPQGAEDGERNSSPSVRGTASSSDSQPPRRGRGRGRGRGRQSPSPGRQHGRGRGRPRRPTPPPPGDASYGPTVNMFSFTSGILGQNVPSIWLDAHKRFANYCSSPWFGSVLDWNSAQGASTYTCKALPRPDIRATKTPSKG